MSTAALFHDVIDPIVPLDSQMGEWPLRSCPEDMQAALFGPVGSADDIPPLYALVEGTRLPRLFSLIEEDDIPHMGLFQGKVAEELGEQVPVLLRLDQDSGLLRMLLTDLDDDDAPTGLLPKQAAIFFRTHASLETLRGHLRRFTQLPTDDDKRVFFRFWEPASAGLYFAHVAHKSDWAAAWFTRPDCPISSIVIPDRTADGWLMHIFTPTIPDGTKATLPLIDHDTTEVLRLARFRANVLEAVILLFRTFPDPLAPQHPRRLRNEIDALYRRMIPLGFHTKQALFMIATWEALYGPQFETRDPDGEMTRIIETIGPERDRMAALKNRIEGLPVDLFETPRPRALVA